MSALPALSIVMPCLNEAARIAKTLERLQPLRQRGVEVIVVDGGSSDGSAALAASLADRVLDAPRGRASQMNAGAAVAHGNVLLFLHADCTLPADADRAILAGLAASGKQWGRFDVELASTHPLLKLVAAMMNLRSRCSGIATGDQGIFMTRALFAEIGGFPMISLMEDIALCKNAKSRNAPLCLRERIVVSPRRWEQHGIWRTIFLMWRLRLEYFLGADPARLAMRYSAAARTPETRILVFARAPEPGAAKTRLIPLLGAAGAAALQNLLLERTLDTAIAAAVGRVELWCAPSAQHPLLAACLQRHGIAGLTQCEGDLGARMQHAAAATLAAVSRVLIIGTDCPALAPENLRDASAALEANDAVLMPAEDGGYVLLGLKQWDASLFNDIAWGSDQVLAATRERLAALNWRWRELPPSWDIDRPADFARLRASGLIPELDRVLAAPR